MSICVTTRTWHAETKVRYRPVKRFQVQESVVNLEQTEEVRV